MRKNECYRMCFQIGFFTLRASHSLTLVGRSRLSSFSFFLNLLLKMKFFLNVNDSRNYYCGIFDYVVMRNSR